MQHSMLSIFSFQYTYAAFGSIGVFMEVCLLFLVCTWIMELCSDQTAEVYKESWPREYWNDQSITQTPLPQLLSNCLQWLAIPTQWLAIPTQWLAIPTMTAYNYNNLLAILQMMLKEGAFGVGAEVLHICVLMMLDLYIWLKSVWSCRSHYLYK